MKHLCLLLLLIVGVFIFSPKVGAQYSSSNYQTNEVQFGAGGDTSQSSSNYQSSVSAGSLGVDNVSSSNYQAYSGFLTPNEPFLEFSIDTSSVNLGLLDSATTKTGTATFHVRSYLNSTYSVQTLGQPPSYTSGSNTHFLFAPSTPTASAVGSEQFGINLVANTSPATFGANPSPQPSSTFAFGSAATNYNTANVYKYSGGDTIAQTTTSGWGQTNYTISYIANISLTTPAGNYSMTQDLIVVATY